MATRRRLVAGLFMGLLPVLAAAMPPQPTTVDNIDEVTHIVIGTARDFAVVSLYNSLLYRLNPEPTHLTSYTAVQLHVEVGEVLYPPGWKTDGPIKYLFGGGLYPVADIKADAVNTPLIYLMRLPDENAVLDRLPVFYSSSGGVVALPLSERKRIEQMIAQRTARERAAAVR